MGGDEVLLPEGGVVSANIKLRYLETRKLAGEKPGTLGAWIHYSHEGLLLMLRCINAEKHVHGSTRSGAAINANVPCNEGSRCAQCSVGCTLSSNRLPPQK